MLRFLKDALVSAAAAAVAYVQSHPASSAVLVQAIVSFAALRGLHLSDFEATVILSVTMAGLTAWVHQAQKPLAV